MSNVMIRELDLESLELYAGDHEENNNQRMCVMEAVAYVAGEPWSAAPECACPVLSAFLRNWNDALDDVTRQRLRPYIPRIIGTNDGHELRRSWMALDWLTRKCAPAFMELTEGLCVHAAALRCLPEIVDKPSLEVVEKTIKDAHRAAAAARDAAWDAARDAAWAAARDILSPAVARLQDSAFALLDRMLSLPSKRTSPEDVV